MTPTDKSDFSGFAPLREDDDVTLIGKREPAAPARKYAYQRVAPGLILLPGNDGETIYAVGRYVDGPSAGLEDEPRDFEAWGWGRLPAGEMDRIQALGKHDSERAVERLRDWGTDNRWPRHKTMKAAMDDALASEARSTGKQADSS